MTSKCRLGSTFATVILLPIAAHSIPVFPSTESIALESEVLFLRNTIESRDVSQSLVTKRPDVDIFDSPELPELPESHVWPRGSSLMPSYPVNTPNLRTTTGDPCSMEAIARSNEILNNPVTVATLTLMSCTFVTLAGFVIYFFFWRWRFRHMRPRPLSTISTTVSTKSTAQELSRTFITSPTLKPKPSIQTLDPICEGSAPNTPVQQFSLSPLHFPSPGPPPSYASGSGIMLPESPARSMFASISSSPASLSPKKQEKTSSFLPM